LIGIVDFLSVLSPVVVKAPSREAGRHIAILNYSAEVKAFVIAPVTEERLDLLRTSPLPMLPPISKMLLTQNVMFIEVPLKKPIGVDGAVGLHRWVSVLSDGVVAVWMGLLCPYTRIDWRSIRKEHAATFFLHDCFPF